MHVLLDTSILMYLAKKPSFFLDELSSKLGGERPVVPEPVMEELRGLTRSRGTKGREARLALTYASGLRTMRYSGEADDALVALAAGKDTVVATLDGNLISTLRRSGVAVATVRGDHLLLLGIK